MIKKGDIKVGLKFFLPCERIERHEDKFLYFVNTKKNCYFGLSEPTKAFCVKSVVNNCVCCDVDGRTGVFVTLDILQEKGSTTVKKMMDEWESRATAKVYSSYIIPNEFINNFCEMSANPFADLINKEMNLAKYQKLIREVADSCIAQSQLKVTLDYLKDYIDVLKNEPDARSFKKITDEMFDTFKAKNHDYGSSFSNLFKECGMIYAYGHMAEKLERVKSLMKDEVKVKGERMKDSLLDLANYAILTVMELERKENNREKV